MHVKVVCTGIFSAFTYLAWNSPRTLSTLNGVLDWCTTWTSRSKAKCQTYYRTPNSTNKNNSNSTEKEKQFHKDGSAQFKPHENEFRIILLGATGSGKSSAGNDLLKNKDGFKTSCYAKSETKESALRTLTWENDSKMYKIDIIDTPAYCDTGLSKRTQNDISDFTIVAVTRYDKLNSEDRNEVKLEMKSKHAPNNIIILRNEDKVDKTADLINKIILSKDQRKNDFASCKLSKHAEDKLQEAIITISKHPTVMHISRDTVKMIPEYSRHFDRRCSSNSRNGD
ncbi:unnamed protein product [Mytilus coruscus]|uniref:AIG1-type G domain-containing protein n=1 Tax=Mytilus coruscus TaxID=42192 RepID=A0A6J8BK21_MYTCO|nr:unnamed protein product [Mytilus coruscus]